MNNFAPNSFGSTDFDRKSYSFELPQSFIAQTPRLPRESAKVLVYDRKTDTVKHSTVGELPSLLANEKLHWVFNNTKVLRARLKGNRVLTTPQGEQPGGKIEFFLLERVGQDSAFVWRGIMKSSASIGPGFKFSVGGCVGIVLEIQKLDASLPVYTAVFDRDPLLFADGEVPLPPYIDGTGITNLDETYNTPFAKVDGAVASPTAGRHFTAPVLEGFRSAGHGSSEITLHVGIGTFLPVKANDIREHVMHEEKALVSPEIADAISDAREDGFKIVAVGTTSARTLEAYTDTSGHTVSGERNVNIFIYPGYQWKGVDVLFTNFHLPESTLLMMVASFIGSREKALELYEIAKRENYKFFSFGDGMLIL